MKQGIHLGPRPPRRSLVTDVGLLLGAGALLLLGIAWARAYRDVSALREEVWRQERALTAEPAPLSEERARQVAARLSAVLDSGAVDGIAPTSVLGFVASALPEDVVLSSLAIDATRSARSVTLEAKAPGGERVSELERRLSASTWVAKTTLLEERRLPEGGLAVRLQLDLHLPDTAR